MRLRQASGNKLGRPPTPEEVVQMARENPRWGYDRIQGALANLGRNIFDQTIGTILKAHGIEPAPQRKRQMTWKTFLQSHWDVLRAIDFTTVEVWTKGGLSPCARSRFSTMGPGSGQSAKATL